MRKLHLLILGLILLIGLVFRTYQIVERFEFAHDGDLYSWIVKDIVVNHHLRLIGQLTSAPGIFIGPIFYYALIPFFLLTNMDPIGAVMLVTIIGLVTIFSFYIVLSKLFKKEVGLIGAFLYATSLSTVAADRWVVPTNTTALWSIWFFYTILSIARGNYSVFPILGFLIGLIWYVHIALIPTLIAVPISIFISRKWPNKKDVLLFFITLSITSLPLILFETRHNFSQSVAFINNFAVNYGGDSGLYKLNHIIITKLAQNTYSLLLPYKSLSFLANPVFIYLFFLSATVLVLKRILKFGELLTIYSWIAGVILFYTISTTPISEYYLTNINVISLSLFSIFLYLIFKIKLFGKILILSFLVFIGIYNLYLFESQYIYHKGYVERKTAVDYIYQDAKKRGYQCFGISYITINVPGFVSIGESVGFRYFFYLKAAHLVHPSLDVPVYNIAIPDELSNDITKQKFGHIGVIPPSYIPSKEKIAKSCQTPNTNLTDPLLGYVD